MIQKSLDEIYLDADRRTAGDAVGLAETVEVLEQLLRRLDVAGLTGDDPAGILWSFQRTGSLPFEADGLARRVQLVPFVRGLVVHRNPQSGGRTGRSLQQPRIHPGPNSLQQPHRHRRGLPGVPVIAE